MKIGDKVRFLSETGGGVIAGFKGNKIVLVEDADGFQIPTAINEVVVVDSDDYSIAKVADAAMKSRQTTTDGRSIRQMMKDGMDEPVDATPDDYDPSEREITFEKQPEERKGGNQLSAYLAFVPMDAKSLTSTRFETYFVNDSNYTLFFTYLKAEGASWTLAASAEVEPNTKQFVEEFGHEDLPSFDRVALQIVAYKKQKPFAIKPPVDVQFRIDTVKFYKFHAFQENEFFEQPALLYTLVEKDKPARPLVIDARQLKEELYGRTGSTASDKKGDEKASSYVRRYENGHHKGNPFIIKHRGDEDVVVVDLHADALLDNTDGMGPADILNYQLKKFHEALDQYAGKKGQRIVFIHGKGAGVLRRALINELTYRYKKYTYQDASFQEYGYGATQVTIK
ncbi:MAG: DUF2027 domain-containing protein [Prevotella sp.]|nr:DUF2027 domain-containing protein [Prevotella sp.]